MATLNAIPRGDDDILTLQFNDDEGVPTSIVGDTVWFIVDDSEGNQVIYKVFQDITSDADTLAGILLVQITSVDSDMEPENYDYGVKWKRIATGNSETISIDCGILPISICSPTYGEI